MSKSPHSFQFAFSRAYNWIDRSWTFFLYLPLMGASLLLVGVRKLLYYQFSVSTFIFGYIVHWKVMCSIFVQSKQMLADEHNCNHVFAGFGQLYGSKRYLDQFRRILLIVSVKTCPWRIVLIVSLKTCRWRIVLIVSLNTCPRRLVSLHVWAVVVKIHLESVY